MRNSHLNFAPGSRFLYSNTNFLLLGRIIEKLTKKKLGDVLAERIFKPLGMNHTLLWHAEIDAVIPGPGDGLSATTRQANAAAHAYPQGGEGGLTSSVEDLLIWSRHFDHPTLEPKSLPCQPAALAPLTGGHANNYRRGVAVGILRGLATIGHGGLWPGFRTEFLRVPAADLNGGGDRQSRQHRSVAAGARRRRRRWAATSDSKPALQPIAEGRDQADRRHLVQFRGAVAVRPGVAQCGEPVVTQNGLPFVLGRRPDGWFGAERGSFEFMLKPGKGTLRVDLGAGRVLTFKKLGKRKAVPAAIAGTYLSTDSGATWHIRRGGQDYAAAVSGPLVGGGAPWPVRGIDADTVEIETPGTWLAVTQLAHLERDRAGKVTALVALDAAASCGCGFRALGLKRSARF